MNTPHRARLRRRTMSSTSRYRNAVLGGVETVDCRARFDPIGGSEDQGDRQTDRTTYNVLLEATDLETGDPVTDLAGFDELLWIDRGLTLKLDGPSVPLDDGLGRLHHWELVAYLVSDSATT